MKTKNELLATDGVKSVVAVPMRQELRRVSAPRFSLDLGLLPLWCLPPMMEDLLLCPRGRVVTMIGMKAPLEEA
jgi:hypothetical protein